MTPLGLVDSDLRSFFINRCNATNEYSLFIYKIAFRHDKEPSKDIGQEIVRYPLTSNLKESTMFSFKEL